MAQQTVLVIDDEAPLLQTIAEALRDEGITVLTAKNGKEGLEVALSKHPDLVLSDNLMPIMTGVEMAAELRKDEWGKKAQVIVMTNYYNAEAVNTSLESGTDYVMKNDLGIDKLVEMVKERLARAG